MLLSLHVTRIRLQRLPRRVADALPCIAARSLLSGRLQSQPMQQEPALQSVICARKLLGSSGLALEPVTQHCPGGPCLRVSMGASVSSVLAHLRCICVVSAQLEHARDSPRSRSGRSAWRRRHPCRRGSFEDTMLLLATIFCNNLCIASTNSSQSFAKHAVAAWCSSGSGGSGGHSSGRPTRPAAAVGTLDAPARVVAGSDAAAGAAVAAARAAATEAGAPAAVEAARQPRWGGELLQQVTRASLRRKEAAKAAPCGTISAPVVPASSNRQRRCSSACSARPRAVPRRVRTPARSVSAQRVARSALERRRRRSTPCTAGAPVSGRRQACRRRPGLELFRRVSARRAHGSRPVPRRRRSRRWQHRCTEGAPWRVVAVRQCDVAIETGTLSRASAPRAPTPTAGRPATAQRRGARARR